MISIVYYLLSHSKSRYIIGIGLLLTLATTSCSKPDLEIIQGLPFDINVMPVPKELSNGESIEIRISIKPTGKYVNTRYFIRYFQFDGAGILRYNESIPYTPNDLYELTTQQFRLYYTSQSTVSQSFDIWISDNFGNEKRLSFSFNNRSNN